jgi:hypothetical protein
MAIHLRNIADDPLFASTEFNIAYTVALATDNPLAIVRVLYEQGIMFWMAVDKYPTNAALQKKLLWIAHEILRITSQGSKGSREEAMLNVIFGLHAYVDASLTANQGGKHRKYDVATAKFNRALLLREFHADDTPSDEACFLRSWMALAVLRCHQTRLDPLESKFALLGKKHLDKSYDWLRLRNPAAEDTEESMHRAHAWINLWIGYTLLNDATDVERTLLCQHEAQKLVSVLHEVFQYEWLKNHFLRVEAEVLHPQGETELELEFATFA